MTCGDCRVEATENADGVRLDFAVVLCAKHAQAEAWRDESLGLRMALAALLPHAQRYFEDHCPDAEEDLELGELVRNARFLVTKAEEAAAEGGAG